MSFFQARAVSGPPCSSVRRAPLRLRPGQPNPACSGLAQLRCARHCRPRLAALPFSASSFRQHTRVSDSPRHPLMSAPGTSREQHANHLAFIPHPRLHEPVVRDHFAFRAGTSCILRASVYCAFRPDRAVRRPGPAMFSSTSRATAQSVRPSTRTRPRERTSFVLRASLPSSRPTPASSAQLTRRAADSRRFAPLVADAHG